jgi:hypothetical protein
VLPELVLPATAVAAALVGARLAGPKTAAGVAAIEAAALVMDGLRIPELAMTAADGRGGSEAIPVAAGAPELEELPVPGLFALPPGPIVAQALLPVAGVVVAGGGA